MEDYSILHKLYNLFSICVITIDQQNFSTESKLRVLPITWSGSGIFSTETLSQRERS